MIQGSFRTRCAAVLVLAAVCVAGMFQAAPASVAYNGTRGLIRTRSADTFQPGHAEPGQDE